MDSSKQSVAEFWNAASCGEELYLVGKDLRDQFINQSHSRYQLEPMIKQFVQFEKWSNKKVLEIGVGLGADHQCFAENGAILFGCDLTERAVNYTKERLSLFGLSSQLQIADAENLPYGDGVFDLVYSWGVIHHSPNTIKAVEEIHRILKPGAEAKIMIYHKHSMVGYMLWFRYGLLKLNPFLTLKDAFSKFMESPGTKAYSVSEAYQLVSAFKNVHIETVLSHGDLLASSAGQRHKGMLLNIARRIFPGFLIRKVFPTRGVFMLLHCEK